MPARIYRNHAVVLLQPWQQRGKVGNRTETAVQQYDNGSYFLAANLVVQQRTLIFDEFGLHGFSLVSGCLKCSCYSVRLIIKPLDTVSMPIFG